MSALAVLQCARPGWWLVTVWLYLTVLPSGTPRSPSFWLGLAYCTLPLNLLVYGWNDAVDFEHDRDSERKGNLLFGGKPGPTLRRWLFRASCWAQLPFVVALTAADCGGQGAPSGWGRLRMLGWFGAVAGVNGLYNHPLPRLSGRPPFDLAAPAGYLLVAQMAVWLNRAPQPAPRFWAFNAFLVLQTQVWAQLVDISVDAASGRRTSVVLLGLRRAQLLLLAVVVASLAFICEHCDDGVVRAFGCLSLVLPLTTEPAEPGEERAQGQRLQLLGWLMNASGAYLAWHCVQSGALL